MVLAIYNYLNVLLETLIQNIYGLVVLNCKLKALREDIQTTELAKNLPYERFFFFFGSTLVGCSHESVCSADML